MDFKSSIHGHPEISFVYVISGKMENTTFTNNPLKQEQKTIITTDDYFHAIGKKGVFDNAIHQLYSIEKSISLHFYSDDARKGIVFDDNGLPD